MKANFKNVLNNFMSKISKYPSRILKGFLVIIFFVILYLFALNGRYEMNENTVFDKWNETYIVPNIYRDKDRPSKKYIVGGDIVYIERVKKAK